MDCVALEDFGGGSWGDTCLGQLPLPAPGSTCRGGGGRRSGREPGGKNKKQVGRGSGAKFFQDSGTLSPRSTYSLPYLTVFLLQGLVPRVWQLFPCCSHGGCGGGDGVRALNTKGNDRNLLRPNPFQGQVSVAFRNQDNQKVGRSSANCSGGGRVPPCPSPKENPEHWCQFNSLASSLVVFVWKEL